MDIMVAAGAYPMTPQAPAGQMQAAQQVYV